MRTPRIWSRQPPGRKKQVKGSAKVLDAEGADTEDLEKLAAGRQLAGAEIATGFQSQLAVCACPPSVPSSEGFASKVRVPPRGGHGQDARRAKPQKPEKSFPLFPKIGEKKADPSAAGASQAAANSRKKQVKGPAKVLDAEGADTEDLEKLAAGERQPAARGGRNCDRF